MMPFTGRKLAGLALVVGAPAFTIAEFVKSGGSMTATDLDQLASNPTLNHIMSEVSVLGLLLTLFGLYAFRRGAAHGGRGEH